MPPTSDRKVVVITGIMAAGKSSVAQRLAERLPRAVHVRGDLFRRMIVSGRADPAPEFTADQKAQLHLRYRLSARTADEYAAAGFTAVVQDIILGADLPAYERMVRTRPCHLIVLAPRAEVVRARESERSKTGYAGGWTIDAMMADLERTPRVGRWLDNSDQTVEQTVEEILAYVT
jgi:chloramphenicol 3-O-phosphotransferase